MNGEAIQDALASTQELQDRIDDLSAALQVKHGELVEARAENARLREALREAAWLAKLARGSSWPGEMAQRVEDAADRVMAAASLSETGGE